MRNACLDMITTLAATDRRVVFVGSDLGPGTMADFQERFPERFFMEGISEAAVVGMAAGLAMEGFVPYVNTIATFLTRRAYEQVALDVCMHKVPVRLIGNGGGLVYAPLGSTHMAIEDIALMRALPNMTVVCPADADEMRRFMALTLDWPDPIYIRLGKGYDPIVSQPEHGFRIGRAIHYNHGADALLVTTGVTLQEAIAAARLLETQGITAGILHMHTVKPLDAEQFLDLAVKVPVIVSLEEHTTMGGLGEALAALLAASGFSPAKRFAGIGIPDRFPDYYGSQQEIMARFGLTPEKIAGTVMRLMR